MIMVLRPTPLLMCAGLWIAFLLSPWVFSQPVTRYVSDTLEAPLRAGASTRHRVVRAVQGGDALQVFEEKEEYTRVRTKDGTQGWILTRYLMDTPSPRQALDSALADNAKLKERVETLTTEQTTLQTELNRVTQEHQRLIQEVAQLRKVASGELALDEQNKVLQQRVVDLEREVQLVQQEKQTMQYDSNNLFLLGAGVLLGGILIGIWIARLPPRRRNTWDRI